MPVKLVVKAGLANQKEYVLEAAKKYSIGRSKEASVVVKDQRASRHHCTVEVGPDAQWVVTDNQSSNGTYVNRQRVASHLLKDGDLLQVGQATFEFTVEVDADAATVVVTASALADAPKPAAAPATPKPAAEPAPAKPAAEPASPKPAAAAPKPATEPVPAKVAAAPRPAPEPVPAKPAPAPAAKPAGGENLDEELKGLFEFLDRIDSTDKPKTSPKSSAPAAGGGAPPAAAPAKDAEPKEGGLLDFLRKKKQD
jgi:pSer/pThr/pTyr-binding forkhead associated (FHA) protein